MCANKGTYKKRALPGVQPDSILRHIYDDMCNGRKFTSLDCLMANHTLYLSKYVSVLRQKYNVPILDKWVVVGTKNKRVKLYWIEMAD